MKFYCSLSLNIDMIKTFQSYGVILNSIICKVFIANSKKTDQLQ